MFEKELAKLPLTFMVAIEGEQGSKIGTAGL